MKIKAFTVGLTLLWLLLAGAAAQQSDGADESSLRPSDIFQFTNIWTVHLSFTPEQWEAMEPKQAGRPQRGNRGGSFLQGPEGGRNGIAAAFGTVFEYVRADVEFGTHKFKDVGVR